MLIQGQASLDNLAAELEDRESNKELNTFWLPAADFILKST